MKVHSLVDLIVSKGNIDKEIIDLSRLVRDEPTWTEILILVRETDQINWLLRPKYYGDINLAAEEIFEIVIKPSKKDYLAKPARRLLDQLEIQSSKYFLKPSLFEKANHNKEKINNTNIIDRTIERDFYCVFSYEANNTPVCFEVGHSSIIPIFEDINSADKFSEIYGLDVVFSRKINMSIYLDYSKSYVSKLAVIARQDFSAGPIWWAYLNKYISKPRSGDKILTINKKDNQDTDLIINSISGTFPSIDFPLAWTLAHFIDKHESAVIWIGSQVEINKYSQILRQKNLITNIG